ELSVGKLMEVSIPVPSLSEQNKIVRILDDVFEKTAKTKENVEKNLQNTRELFESYLEGVFSNSDALWEVKRLEEVCEISMGQSPDGSTYNTTGKGIPLINGPIEFSQNSFGMTIPSKFTTQPTKIC